MRVWLLCGGTSAAAAAAGTGCPPPAVLRAIVPTAPVAVTAPAHTYSAVGPDHHHPARELPCLHLSPDALHPRPCPACTHRALVEYGLRAVVLRSLVGRAVYINAEQLLLKVWVVVLGAAAAAPGAGQLDELRMGGGAAKGGGMAPRQPRRRILQPALPELLVRQGAAGEEEQRDLGGGCKWVE